MLNVLALKIFDLGKFCYAFILSLVYKSKETICNIIDDVQIYKKVTENKHECMDILLCTPGMFRTKNCTFS